MLPGYLLKLLSWFYPWKAKTSPAVPSPQLYCQPEPVEGGFRATANVVGKTTVSLSMSKATFGAHYHCRR